MKVQIKYLHPLAESLTRGTEGSAGYDLIAAIDEPKLVKANSCELINSGVSIFIDNPNYAAFLLPRSGLGHKKGIILGNSVGLIDSDYQGEILISCWNRTDKDYKVQPGERIAQMVFLPVVLPKFEIVKDFVITSRGSNGFGSTG